MSDILVLTSKEYRYIASKVDVPSLRHFPPDFVELTDELNDKKWVKL